MSAVTLDTLYGEYSAATGDAKEAAKTKLVKAMYRDAWPIIWSRLQRAHPEIVNDSVTKAVLYLDKFRGEARFSTWFYSIVMSYCNTALRAKERRANEISLEQMTDEGSEPIIETANAATASLDLAKFAADLNPQERRILELKATGKTYAEIAKDLGITRIAANSRWRRLQERIEKASSEPGTVCDLFVDSAMNLSVPKD
jgi:RNA polymerase sigma factor (sigma-70 family)